MTRCRYPVLIIFFLFIAFPPIGLTAPLFHESFEDVNFASRGWYDSSGGILSTTEHVSGSTRSFECRFLVGGTKCNGGTPSRHLFTETASVYVSYYVKYSANWEGSNRPYHPHEFYLLTNADSSYIGPSRTHLTAYIEQNEGIPRLQIQDALNIDANRVGQDLVNVTELRAVAGCNGANDRYGDGDCWVCSAGRCNEKIALAPRTYFGDTPGTLYKNDWHHIEAYFSLNSIVDGRGMADGIMRYWYDGNLVIDRDRVMFRTAQHPGMRFNQILISPYIGDGSPVEQTMWIDNLTVMTSRDDTQQDPPPAAPQNLRVVQ